MDYKIKKISIEILTAILLIYSVTMAFIFAFPELVFYSPSPIASDISVAHKQGFDVVEVNYFSEDGTKLLGWITKPENKQKKMVVFFHGNSHNLERFIPKIKPIADAGFGTFMAKYRGFGTLKGKISQANLRADAIAAVRYLNSIGYENKDIVLYGLSLGSHMAINTAYNLRAEGDFEGVILEVPFDNLVNVVNKLSPIRIPAWAIRDKYDNLEMIQGIGAPLLVLAAEQDALVPSVLAKNLFNHANPPKRMKIFKKGGHSTLHYYKSYNTIIEWLKDNEKR